MFFLRCVESFRCRDNLFGTEVLPSEYTRIHERTYRKRFFCGPSGGSKETPPCAPLFSSSPDRALEPAPLPADGLRQEDELVTWGGTELPGPVFAADASDGREVETRREGLDASGLEARGLPAALSHRTGAKGRGSGGERIRLARSEVEVHPLLA